MKSFLLAGYSLLSFAAIAQSGSMIVEDANLWSTVDIHCQPEGSNYSTYFIRFDEDTLINGLNYKVIRRCNEEYLINWDDYGFIREDNENRVFLRSPVDEEGLIYDFGVQPGDSLQARNIFLNNDTLQFVVLSVDSVLLLNGYKKRITLYEYLNQKEEVWIEGLGSYYGILNSCNNSYGTACGLYEALCYERNGMMIYENPNYETCYCSVTVNSGYSEIKEINIYPNPAKGNFFIEQPYETSSEIEIFSLNGQKIFNKMFFDKKVNVILQGVDKGTYIIKFKDFIFSYPPYKLIVD
jgi:hypothetical protein